MHRLNNPFKKDGSKSVSAEDSLAPLIGEGGADLMRRMTEGQRDDKPELTLSSEDAAAIGASEKGREELRQAYLRWAEESGIAGDDAEKWVSENCIFSADGVWIASDLLNPANDAGFPPKLKVISGNLQTSNNRNIHLEDLVSVGGDIHIYNGGVFKVPKLESTDGGVYYQGHGRLEFPSLQTVGGVIDARMAESLNVEKLDKVSGFRVSQTAIVVCRPEAQKLIERHDR